MSAAKKTKRRSSGRARKTGISWVRFAVTGAAILVMVLALLLHSGSQPQRYERYRRLAAECYQKGEYDRALSNLRKAEEISSGPELLMLMADCYEAQGNWDRALEIMRKMDLNEQAVSERIAALEQRKQQNQNEGMLTVAGERYDPATTELDLRGRGLGNGVLQELLQLYALNRLSLADNAISDAGPLAALEGLQNLDLSGNRISDVRALGKLKNLHNLSLDGNPLTDVRPLCELQELRSLSLRGVTLPEGELEALSRALPQCAILADGDKEGKQDLLLSGRRFPTDVTELDLSGLELRDISCLSLCGELKKLVLTDNEISDLSPLMNLQNLEILRAAGNQISDLRPLMGMTGLRQLDVSRNAVRETSALGNLERLQTLDLSDNPIGDFSGLKNLFNLETLRLENTGVTDEALPVFYDLKKLGILALERNQGITADAMKELRNQLPSSCSVVHGTLVLVINLGGRDFRTDETSLSIEGAELTSLYGLEKFECLESVQLGRNRIEDLSAFQNTHSQGSIKTLDLSNNLIQDLSPLAALKALETLDLHGNQISSLEPLTRMSQLKKVDLSGNPLEAEQIEELRRALPGCEIVF